MLGGGYSIGFTKVSAQRMLTFDTHHVSIWCAKKSCLWVGCCCLEFSDRLWEFHGNLVFSALHQAAVVRTTDGLPSHLETVGHDSASTEVQWRDDDDDDDDAATSLFATKINKGTLQNEGSNMFEPCWGS